VPARLSNDGAPDAVCAAHRAQRIGGEVLAIRIDDGVMDATGTFADFPCPTSSFASLRRWLCCGYWLRRCFVPTFRATTCRRRCRPPEHGLRMLNDMAVSAIKRTATAVAGQVRTDAVAGALRRDVLAHIAAKLATTRRPAG
jgi:hypothetical protein